MSQRPKKSPQLKAPNYSLFLELQKLGYETIIGVDEVGRGAVAGPVVVAAVQVRLPTYGVTDSKMITPARRSEVAALLHRDSSIIRIGSATNYEIDELGMSKALSLAYERALTDVKADLVLTDHYSLPTSHRFIRATKGDSLFYPVAAASIIAKVYRDQLMSVYHRFYSNYGWNKNAGYGTSMHLAAVKETGHCPLHRVSFL